MNKLRKSCAIHTCLMLTYRLLTRLVYCYSSTVDLNFKSNSITGSVPSEMANMRSLQILSLIANYLTGNVPREFASMSNLQVLELDNNYLEGTVPTEVCQLTNDGTLFIFSADCLRKELHCPFTTCCTWCNP
jgi:hypothetical protein